ncbi:MAG: branched-chain amino acid ABC transporter permease [Acholeplasmataceae bacterium]
MKSLKQILNTINTYVKKFFAIMKKPLSMVIFVVSIFIILLILIESNAFSRYFTTLIILILVMIVMSTSLNIATGFLGQLHLGHAAFMGIGAYTASLIALALEDSITNPLLLFILSTIVAMIVAGIASLLVGTPALRLRGDYLGIMTLGFGEIVKTMITNLKDITNGAQGLYGIPRIMDFPIAYWTTVLVVLVIYLFMNSRHGRAIISIKEDEIASESVGINITKYKLLGFVLASMFAAVGGAMFAFRIGFLAPVNFNFLKSVEIFVIVILGGMGSLSGSIVASIVLVSLPEILRSLEDYRFLLYSTLLIVMMLFRPQGLLGHKE